MALVKREKGNPVFPFCEGEGRWLMSAEAKVAR